MADSEPRLRVLNLGAGVQSTTMALMASEGHLLDPPDCAIFADTGWEPRATYEHLDRLRELLAFPLHVASGGNLRERLMELPNEPLERKKRYASVPFFTPGGGMGRRQCTGEYKIKPIRKTIKVLLGVSLGRHHMLPPGAVECWIGISTDEASRMKPSDVGWVVNRWPLVDLMMSRHDCIVWLMRHRYPIPPKSSCLGCPYHSDEYWGRLKRESPSEWADTVAVDRAVRNGEAAGMKQAQYLHRSCKPLGEVPLPGDEGQLQLFDPEGAENECTGFCWT